MEKITELTSKTIVLPIDDVDTDQIVPARFLTTTEREGIGVSLFADWRVDKQGTEIADFPLNAPEAKERQILVAGRNFGCGSSREHAPWAIYDFGIRAVISSEIADIFRNNSLNNGLVPVVVDVDTHQWLLDNPGAEVTVDMEASVVRLPDGKEAPFPIEPFARHCIMEGIDQMGFLLQNKDKIAAFESYLSYAGRWRLDGDEVVHSVEMALNPNAVGLEQRRRVDWAGEDLVLSYQRTPPSGTVRTFELTWRRVATEMAPGRQDHE